MRSRVSLSRGFPLFAFIALLAGCESADDDHLAVAEGDLGASGCAAGTKYIRAGDKIGTETWKTCEIVLLETVTVPKGSVLTIAPGVTVKGNYLGTGAYGTVQLVVDGKLQAVGSATKPIKLTSLENGWKGLVLNGDTNKLTNVLIEQAETGVTLNGPNNVLTDVSVTGGDQGISIGPESTDNTASKLRVTKNTRGIFFEAGGQAVIEDAVIVGNGTTEGSGIESTSHEMSKLRRSFVSNFAAGLWLAGSALEVTDTTITRNAWGVYVTGEGAGLYEPSCPTLEKPAPPPPAPPQTWRDRDPSFIRTDITNNTKYGILMDAPELVVVEECNVTGNAVGIDNDAVSIHPKSRIVNSNIFGNGTTGLQVESYHLNGTLDISGNYWAQISDPMLSASWKMTHDLERTCEDSMSTTTKQADSFSSGIYSCRWASSGTSQWSGHAASTWHTYQCAATVVETQEGAFTFKNFSPEKLAAGPKESTLSSAVKNARSVL